jgi:hypothetical protein
MMSWQDALHAAQQVDDASHGSAVVALEWDEDAPLGVEALFDSHILAQITTECHRALLPGAHIALWVPGAKNDIAGIALRLAGFEIRDSVATVSQGDVWYWLIGRKQLPGTVIEAALEYGTGGINIGATRIGSEKVTINRFDNGAKQFGGAKGEPFESVESQGRFSPNVLLDADSVAEVDEQAPSAGAGGPASGPTHSGSHKSNSMAGKFNGMGDKPATFHADSGGASRFFPHVGRVNGVPGAEWILRLVATPSAPALVLSNSALDEVLTEEGYRTSS